MSGPGPHILVVDDDARLRKLLTRHLRNNGFVTAAVGDGGPMWDFLAKSPTDLIILDVMLPGVDGFDLVRTLKERDEAPVLMLSARSEETDRIVGLEIGADDYLPKPFDPRELVSRVRAILRRRNRHGEELDLSCGQVTFGPYLLDLEARVISRGGQPLELAESEMDLLLALARNPGRVLGRDELIDILKGTDRTPFDRSIDIRVARLRSRIEDNPRSPRFIRTVWGAGYRFVPDTNAGE